MRRTPIVVVLLLLIAPQAPAAGQTLSDNFRQLFTFGDCGEPLCLTVNGAVHGLHYIPSVTQGENDMLSFLTGSIATSLGNLPFTAASSGVTFSFVGGVPVATSVSGGPIFAERAQTLGRGRVLAGLNVNGLSMDNVRGVPLNDLSFRFTHQNVQGAALGDPVYERDVIEVTTDLSLSLLVTSFFASYGVLDNIDIGVLVPVIRASLDGTSNAVIDAYSPPSPHQFGTPTNPSSVASSTASGSSIGIGDIAVRAKVNLQQTDNLGIALLGDVRLPTGDEENFLGSGNAAIRALGVVSGRFGNFAPHVNAGFAYRAGDNQNSSILATLGFDQLLSSNVSMAAELITDLEMGESKLELPGPVIFTAPTPTPEEVDPTDIPIKKDNLIDASFGLKFQLPNDYRLLSNILFPLTDGGMRPKFLWTIGFERTF